MAILDLLHAPCFAVLTVLLLRALHHWPSGRTLSVALVVGGGIVCLGWGFEILQGFLARTPSLQDGWANTLGVGAGVIWSRSWAISLRGPRLRMAAVCSLLLLLASLGPLRVLSAACWQQLQSRARVDSTIGCSAHPERADRSPGMPVPAL